MTLNGFVRATASGMQIAAVLLAVVGVVYRATLYWKIPVPPGEPYGIGDLLDFVFALLLLGVSGVCVALGLLLVAFSQLKGRRHGYSAVLVGVGSFVGYYFLHNAVPRLI